MVSRASQDWAQATVGVLTAPFLASVITQICPKNSEIETQLYVIDLIKGLAEFYPSAPLLYGTLGLRPPIVIDQDDHVYFLRHYRQI